MKRVSFKVAKALRKAGYPQEKHNGMYFKDGDDTPLNIIVKSVLGGNVDEYLISAPTYLEAWLWLWREKRTDVTPEYDQISGLFSSCGVSERDDPEDAIAAAIEYLVDNDGIK